MQYTLQFFHGDGNKLKWHSAKANKAKTKFRRYIQPDLGALLGEQYSLQGHPKIYHGTAKVAVQWKTGLLQDICPKRCSISRFPWFEFLSTWRCSDSCSFLLIFPEWFFFNANFTSLKTTELDFYWISSLGSTMSGKYWVAGNTLVFNLSLLKS